MDEEVWRWIWLALAAGGVVGEIATAGTFFLLPFGVGAAVSCVLAFAGVGVGLQWFTFVVVSVVAVLATRPLARRLDRITAPAAVGAHRWIGQYGFVLNPIGPHEVGTVRVGGEEWRAESRDGVPLPEGARVLVVEVTGTRLVVLPLELPEGDL